MMSAKDPMEKLAEMLKGIGGIDLKGVKLSMGGNDDEEGDVELPDEKKQLDMLHAFLLNPRGYAVGTRVVRNSAGKLKYKFPRNGDVALVASTFDIDQQEGERSNNPATGTILVLQPSHVGPTPHFYIVDLRYYKPYKAEPKNS